jgi:methionine sulfoxide reductase heme-binding subunit
MDARKASLATGAILALAGFIIFSAYIQDTQYIWLQERALGLMAYVAFFLSVALGEWKLIMKGKGEFKAFRYHHGVSIAAVVLVLAHFISAVMDKYKWGKNLVFTQYLGFSFSDKWLMLLSLGTLAFYMLIIVGATSSKRMCCALGFKRWKLFHYLAYVAFFISYIHAVNLGTDVKTSALRTVVHPAIVFSFLLVLGLLATRVASGWKLLADETEAVLTAAFIVFLLLASSGLASMWVKSGEELATLELSVNASRDNLRWQQDSVEILKNDTSVLIRIMKEVNYGQVI